MEKNCVKMKVKEINSEWTGLIWLRTEKSEHGNGHSVFVKCGKLLNYSA
jgi:hypothetical protein